MSEPIAEPTKKEKNEKQKALHAKLEKAASNWDKKDWTVSQDDIHFAVHMLDTHHLGLEKLILLIWKIEYLIKLMFKQIKLSNVYY